MDMKRVLIAFIAVIVVGGAAYYLSSPEQLPAPEPEVQDENMNEVGAGEEGPSVDPEFHALITYTDSGYSPSEITITRGQTVRWVNNSESSRETWPASAVHPTHSIYPEKSEDDCLGSSFDACRGLLPGEFWEFTFDEVGEWRYHDHIHASQTGVIIVTE